MEQALLDAGLDQIVLDECEASGEHWDSDAEAEDWEHVCLGDFWDFKFYSEDRECKDDSINEEDGQLVGRILHSLSREHEVKQDLDCKFSYILVKPAVVIGLVYVSDLDVEAELVVEYQNIEHPVHRP